MKLASSTILKLEFLYYHVLIALGEVRTSQVWVFDLKKKKWSKLIEDKNGDSRCDPPVGLSGELSIQTVILTKQENIFKKNSVNSFQFSGHTATAVNSKLICVIGREGGVRIQRRYGQMYFLHFDLTKNIYWYSEAPMLLQSRSGHSTILSPPSKGFSDLLIFGGRDSGLLDVLGKLLAYRTLSKSGRYTDLT